MTQYILLIHANAKAEATPGEWTAFFEAANASGVFRGGSEIGEGEVIGAQSSTNLSSQLGGYMRFDAEDKQQVLDLLKLHPVVMHGGTVELCVMPKSQV